MGKYNNLVPKEDLIIFSRQLALILDSDVTIYEGVELIKKKSDNPVLVRVLDEALIDIQEGRALSDTLKRNLVYFNPFFVNMVEIGEESGELSGLLNQVADAYEKELEISQKVRSAVLYPIILSVLMLGVIVLLVVEILPLFNDILLSLGGSMPSMTAMIMNIGSFIGMYLWPILIGIVILIMLCLIYAKTEKGLYLSDRLKFQLPIISRIVSATTAVRFARNLAILLKVGFGINNALEMVKQVIGNRYVEKKLTASIDEFNKGKPLGDVIEDLNLFPWVLIKLFSVAGTTGHMDDTLNRAAQVMEKEVDYRLQRLTAIIEPMLIIILSIIIGVILISVILPIIDIMNSIG